MKTYTTQGTCSRAIEYEVEGLLAYAVAHGDKAEEERIRAELVRMVEAL